jgi:hypothetical protein
LPGADVAGIFPAMSSLRDQLLAAAEVYCAANGITKAALGARVMKDNKFFARIERGGGLTVRTFEKFMEVFQGKGPDGTAAPPAATDESEAAA